MSGRRMHRAWWPTLALAATGCAWSNPANRPLWNAFEANVVPAGDTAFYATLPLTVPVGFSAILLDTLVVHPVSVIDDAAADAADDWQDVDWQQRYYTELGLLPLRVAWTPCAFAGAFLGRSCFDIPPHGTDMAKVRADEAKAKALAPARDVYLDFFAQLARGGSEGLGRNIAPPTWDADLARAYEDALAHANAAGRLELYRSGRRHKMPPLVAQPWIGLRDADPVVRYMELLVWPRSADVPEPLRDNLRADACESVRLLALRRWP